MEREEERERERVRRIEKWLLSGKGSWGFCEFYFSGLFDQEKGMRKYRIGK